MAEYTSGGKVDVERFCQDHNMTCTGFMINGTADGNGNLVGFVDFTPGGQDDNHHYALLCFGAWPYSITVKSIFTAGTTAASVFIFGINP
jgi:hypothetical protein